MFHRQWREESLAALARPFDLVVVGGGINGCGIFFDAAQRGLRVLLVEKSDLASGTSSRSSKLIHGGLRYLKNLQVGVTLTSVRERDRQLALNPHLVTPLPWLYPTYRGDATPGWKAELGLRIYDAMTRLPEKHHRVDAAEMAEMAPGAVTEGLDRALVYQDARVDDARLTWAVAATGAAYGGHLLTRAEPEKLRRGPGGTLRGLVLRDLEATGDRPATHEVDAPLVVNATGVWVDRLRHRFGLDGDTVRPSRGSHILLAADRLPIRAAVTVLHPDDRRPAFLIPHPEGVLVGTTDLYHHAGLDDPRPTPSEIDYLLAACNAGFSGEPVTRADVLGAFAGIRPIVDDGGDRAEGNPSAASREEAIWHEEGLLSVAGGKLTTWRATAEEAVDEALKHLPEDVARKASRCATAGTPLAGLAPADLGERLARAHPHLDAGVAHGLARRLGAAAWTAVDGAEEGDLRPLGPDLAPELDLCAAEIRAHCRQGAVVHLSDLLLRRVRLGMWRPAAARELAEPVADLAGAELGWDADRRGEELERFATELAGWSLDGVSSTGDGPEAPT